MFTSTGLFWESHRRVPRGRSRSLRAPDRAVHELTRRGRCPAVLASARRVKLRVSLPRPLAPASSITFDMESLSTGPLLSLCESRRMSLGNTRQDDGTSCVPTYLARPRDAGEHCASACQQPLRPELFAPRTPSTDSLKPVGTEGGPPVPRDAVLRINAASVRAESHCSANRSSWGLSALFGVGQNWLNLSMDIRGSKTTSSSGELRSTRDLPSYLLPPTVSVVRFADGIRTAGEIAGELTSPIGPIETNASQIGNATFDVARVSRHRHSRRRQLLSASSSQASAS